MIKKRIILAFICLLLPIILRLFWFYPGLASRNKQVEIPNYSEIKVELPTLSTPMPIDAQFEIKDSVKKRVLFDFAHRNQFTYDEVNALRNNLIWRNAEILSLDFESDLSEALKKSDAFVILAPTSFYTAPEIEQIEEFVNRGGRLLVIADPTRSFSENDSGREESVILVNEILQPFQLVFRNDYVYNLRENEGNFRNVFVKPAPGSIFTEVLDNLVFYAAHSLDSRSNMVLMAGESGRSSLQDRETTISVAALDESKNVLALGDMSFMIAPYQGIADNYILVEEIAEFLVGGNRSIWMSDFPYLFRRDTGIILDDEISLDSDLAAIISDLKNRHMRNDISISILDNENETMDLIYLSIYPPYGELEKITQGLGIEFDPNAGKINSPTPQSTESPDETTDGNESQDIPSTANESGKNDGIPENTIYIPDFGFIPDSEFALIILSPQKEQLKVLLLGSTAENAVDLLAKFLDNSLIGCLESNQIAICEQNHFGFSKDILEPETVEVEEDIEALEDLIESTIPTPTKSITPTPTPAG